MRQRVAHEVDAATLPSGVEHLGDGGLDAPAIRRGARKPGK
jgi:hypothetical protein